MTWKQREEKKSNQKDLKPGCGRVLVSVREARPSVEYDELTYAPYLRFACRGIG